jgi:hypothetical protein
MSAKVCLCASLDEEGVDEHEASRATVSIIIMYLISFINVCFSIPMELE